MLFRSILAHLAKTGQQISAIAAAIPTSVMLKRYVPVEPQLLFSKLNDVRKEVEDAGAESIDFSDGIKLSWADGWVHIRASNTESMIRIIAESDDPERARVLLDWALDRVKKS